MKRIIGILFSKSGNTLKQLKLRILTASVIAVYLHLIAELKKKICKSSVITEKDADGKVISYFPVSRGIKTHQYTMSLTIDRKTKELKDILLFNDLEDPYQMQNLPWQENKGIVSDLCKQMIPLLKEADDPWYKEQILKELIPYGKE